jgi:NitT/TauT family transport system permease protein
MGHPAGVGYNPSRTHGGHHPADYFRLRHRRHGEGRRRQQIFKVVLPAASGLIFAGFRLGLAQGLTGAVLAELMITPTGIGDLITYNRSIANYPNMFAAVFSIIIFATVAVTLLQKLETRYFRPDQKVQEA